MDYSDEADKFSLVGILFGLAFFAAGSFFLYGMALKPLIKVIDSQDWRAQNCLIKKSRVKESRSSDGTTYRVDIEMQWVVDDVIYRGGSYDFNNASSSGYSGKSKIIQRYPVGSHHPCWVDPEKPSSAVLSRAVPTLVYIVVPFISIFILIGAFFMLASAGWLPESWVPRFSNQHKRVTTEAAGSSKLNPEQSPSMKVFGVIAFATIWNGVTSIFVYQVIQSHLAEDPEWFLTIFMIPFVIVGVGALVGVAYTLAAQLNPRISMYLSEGRPLLGQRVSLQWHFDRPVDRVRHLTVCLVGEERATYKQGTRTTTDKHTFYEYMLSDTTMPSFIAKGSATVEIPINSMHTFDSGNNAICWSIRIHGYVTGWPDIKDNFPITVRPRAR